MEHSNITDRFKSSTCGMTVPDNYFESFNTKMIDSLQQQPWEIEQDKPKMLQRTLWQKVRPYAYLAAMFLGIWCMMNMFSHMRQDPIDAEISNNTVLMAALDNDSFYYDEVAPEMSSGDLYDDLYEQGFDPTEIQNDN